MKTTAFKQGLNGLNLLLVAAFLVLALYSAIGQQILPYIGQYRLDAEQFLSEQLQSQVRIGKLSGDMTMLTPSVHIEDISLSEENISQPAVLTISSVDAVLDSRLSLINLTPVFKSIRLSGITLVLDDNISIQGSGHGSSANELIIQRFVETLLLQQHIEFTDVSIETRINDQKQTISIDQVVMSGDGFNRLMTGSLSYGKENEIKTAVRIYSQGSPYDLDDFYARGVMEVPNLDLAYWLKQFRNDAGLKEFNASGILGFEFENGLLNYAKLNMVSPLLLLDSQSPIKQINTEIWLKQEASDTWGVWLENGHVFANDKNWKLENIGVKLNKTVEGPRWQGFIEKVDLKYYQDLLLEFKLLPKNAAEYLMGLQPKGFINNASLIYHDKGNEEPEITLAGELNGISSQAHGAIPELGNINGVIAGNQYRGRLQFSSENMELHFPTLYENAFQINKGSGQIDWYIEDEQVKVIGDAFHLALDSVESIKGGFQLWLPTNEEGDPALALNLSLNQAHVSAQHNLVPKVVNKNLREWLDTALLDGFVEQGNFFLFSSLENTQPLSQLEMYFDFNNVDLSYLDKWPSVERSKGKIFVANTSVFGVLDAASTLGGNLTESRIAYQKDRNDQGFLWVNGIASGRAMELLSYLQVTQLQEVVSGVMDNWTLSGKHHTNLGLKIPLDTPISETVVDVNIVLSDADLNIADQGLVLSSIDGSINYRNSDGLSSTGLSSKLWGKAVKTSISSQVDGLNMKTDIAFSGVVDSVPLKSWLKLGLLNGLSGKSLVNGHFYIDTHDNGFTGLKLESELKGMSLNLPKPLFKSPDQQANFTSSLQIDDGLTFKLSYDEKVNLAMRLENGQFKSGQVFLGATEAYVPSTEGMIIQGHIPSLNVDEWLDTWKGIELLEQQYTVGKSNSEDKNFIKKVNLSTDDLIFNELHFEHVKTEISSIDNSWLLDIDAPIAKGKISYRENTPIEVKLDYLHWPMLETSENVGSEDALADIDPSLFPEINFDIAEIFLGPTNYGQWSMLFRPSDNGLSISSIDGKIKKLNVKGAVSWDKTKDISEPQKTSVDLVLTSKDIGGIQRAWHKKPAVEAGFGEAKLDINWQGSPAEFQLENLNGNVDVHFKDGRFIETGDTAALSAFGILNFGAIGRRLRLDFSDVYQSGLAFDSVKGKTEISNGLITIVDTLDFQGPSANFSASGTVNTLNKELNQELSVTFPIFSTLPIVAILAGFAPPIAASIFVGEKLVGDEIERFSSATYKLSGTWDKPELNIMKRFDNEIDGKKEKTFWHRMKDVFGMGSDE